MSQHRSEVGRLDYDVQESLDDIESIDGGFVCNEPVAYFGSYCFRRLACGLYPGENNDCEIAFKLFLGRLRHYRRRVGIDSVQSLHGMRYGLCYDVIY